MAEDQRVDAAPNDAGEETDDRIEDFAALLEESQAQRGEPIRRDNRIEGTVVSIGEDWIFVDIGAKSEGSISREELTDEDGQLKVGVGDPVAAYVVSNRDGEISLSVKMTAAASEEAVRGAFKSGVPVEGLVMAERKGGYTVKALGKDAFCPYSQIDQRSGGAPDDYLGQRFNFRITEYSGGGRNVVVSRRQILEEERASQAAQLKETLEPGDLITGQVCNLTDFGAFVDIGGIEGLVPMSELAWGRVKDASEVLKPGQEITVKVMSVDWGKDRISLSFKQTLEDPWSTVEERYRVGQTLDGTITRLMDFGAFVELEPGIEGLIHISNLGAGRRINHPREVVSEGDKVFVGVLSLDREARRIGLELNVVAEDDADAAVAELKKGDVVTGMVDAVKDYGVFVAFPGAKSGLLHVSEIEGGGRGDLRKRFPTGSAIDVEILDIDPETKKISLSTKSLEDRAEKAHFKVFSADRGGERSFGTLGDLLKEKLKE